MRSFARRIDAGTLKRTADYRGDSGPTGEPLQWCLCSDEDLPRGAARASLAQVLRQCFADVVWKREAVNAGMSIANLELAGLPVDVLQLQSYHLAGPKAEPRKQEDDRVVARPTRCSPIALSEGAQNLIILDGARDR